MPNYDWECSEGHEFEKFLSLNEWKDKMRIECEFEKELPSGTKFKCGKDAHQVVLPRGASTTIPPFVYYLNKNGEVRIPGASDLPTPPGHTRCEITTLGELRNLEKRVGNEERAKISRHREESDYYEGIEADEERRQFRQEVERMSPAGKEFARIAMQRNNARRDYKSWDPGLFFSILHNDENSGSRHRAE